MQATAAASTLQQELKAQHGQFHEGTYVLGVNLQLVTPEKERLCLVCKGSRMRLWEEAGTPNPKPRWWVCERQSHSDVCVYSCPAEDFPEISGIPEMDGTYHLSGLSLTVSDARTTCQACDRQSVLMYHERIGTWGTCECGFTYHAGLYSPRGHMMKALVEKRKNFREALKWYGLQIGPSA